MINYKQLVTIFLISLSFSQYDFSLEDINDTSPFFDENVGPSVFPAQVSVVYFGHYN